MPQPAPPSTAGTRLHLERLEGMHLVGWACNSAAPGTERIVVMCGTVPVSAAVRRVSRADVARAMGVEELRLGFEVELPVSIWQQMADHGALWLEVDGAKPTAAIPQPSLKTLVTRMLEISQQTTAEVQEARLGPLRQHIALARKWAPGQGVEQLDLERVPPARHLEGWSGLSIRGWVADTPEQRRPLRVRCEGRIVECPVMRLSRKDVAGALGLEDDRVGFDLELPGEIWREFAGATTLQLQVLVGPHPCGAPLTLSREELPERLSDALGLGDPGERLRQSLLAMEHLSFSGQLDSLEAGLSRAISKLADAAGVGDWLQPASPEAPATPERPPRRYGPRGRLGRWLQQPGAAKAAVSLVRFFKRHAAFSQRAESLQVVLLNSLGLFDKALYDEQVPPEARAGLSALRHYVRHGDDLSLVPMCLFDPRHYTGQLEGRRHPGINRLLHFALVGQFQGLTPCAWFDGAYYAEANQDVQASQRNPLLHFLNWGWHEHRRPHPTFEPTVGARQNLLQRLARSGRAKHADPLVNYLLEGLPADAPQADRVQLPWVPPTHLDGKDYLDPAPWRALPPRPSAPRLDVVVPVYAGVQESLRCLWSVLTCPVKTPFELVVIDDCSPDPALSAFLRELAGLGLLKLLVNPANLGFVATVNSGLSLHWDRDAVILNADTQVYGDWLDRLVAHAHAEPRAASITPLSNNATVCSYPRTLHSNWERLEVAGAEIDALAAACNRGDHVIVPTGVGFCMWMRRTCLDSVGLLDTERFGRGYGEENDWCMRTNAAGWVQLIATDIYVLHQGSVSFRAEASERTRAALQTLLDRHPDYQKRIDTWIASDPLHPARARLDAARLRRPQEPAGNSALLSTVLMVSHARGGGTARHEEEEAQRLMTERGLATVFLRPSRAKGCVSLSSPGMTELPNLDALPLQREGLLLDILRGLSLQEVQLHHLADHASTLTDLLPAWCEMLGVPLKVTLHDYYMVCPRINLVDASGRYCGEPAPDACDRCLQRDAEGRAAGPIVSWRRSHGRLLASAAERLVPDPDVATRLKRYFPAQVFTVKAHEPLVRLAPVAPGSRPAVRHVLVIGSLSVIKGYEVLLGLAEAAASRTAGLRFTLLGHSKDDASLRQAGVDVRGRYEDPQLPRLIEEVAPDLILLPSVWPETYSYVLSAAMASGRRVATFDLGAPARRLREAGADAIFLPIDEAAHPELLAGRLLAG
jgi:O-antigen biosynthesis protein